MYWNPYGRRMRDAVRRHLVASAAAVPPSRLVAVNASGGLPAIFGRRDPTALILHTTFLAARWLDVFPAWRARMEWLGRLSCPKLALPQDDYDHHSVLDEWLSDLGVTNVF